MKYSLFVITFLFTGCHIIDPIVVPIHKSINELNTSTPIYQDTTSHTKLSLHNTKLVWKKEF